MEDFEPDPEARELLSALSAHAQVTSVRRTCELWALLLHASEQEVHELTASGELMQKALLAPPARARRAVALFQRQKHRMQTTPAQVMQRVKCTLGS